MSDLLSKEESRVRFIGTVFDLAKLQSLRWHCRAYAHGHSVGGTNPSLLEALGCSNRILAHDNVFNRVVAKQCARYFSCAEDIKTIIEEFDSRAPAETDRKSAFSRLDEKYNWAAVVRSYFLLLNNNR